MVLPDLFFNNSCFYFAGLIIFRIFALAFESESCKQEKHCDIVLSLKSAKFLIRGTSIYAFAWLCVLYP